MKARYVLWDREAVRSVSTHKSMRTAGRALIETGPLSARARFRILLEFPTNVISFDVDPTQACIDAFYASQWKGKRNVR